MMMTTMRRSTRARTRRSCVIASRPTSSDCSDEVEPRQLRRLMRDPQAPPPPERVGRLLRYRGSRAGVKQPPEANSPTRCHAPPFQGLSGGGSAPNWMLALRPSKRRAL
jgi:hypothetical protein